MTNTQALKVRAADLIAGDRYIRNGNRTLDITVHSVTAERDGRVTVVGEITGDQQHYGVTSDLSADRMMRITREV